MPNLAFRRASNGRPAPVPRAMAALEVLDGDPLFGAHGLDVVRVHGDGRGLLRHLHWVRRSRWPTSSSSRSGELSTNDLIHDVMTQEYLPHGSFRYNEQCLMVRFPDGGRELDLQYRVTTRPIPS